MHEQDRHVVSVKLQYLMLELFNHDAEAFGTGIAFRIVELLLNVQRHRFAILEPHKIDGWQLPNLQENG